jgi:formylglycine-generating enzyme
LDDSVRKLQEYVYAKYVDGESPGAIDEVAAFKRLEEWFSQPDHAENPDCFTPGVLAFEQAWGVETEEEREHWFRRAKYWLERYRGLAGEAWDVVDDRLADINGYFEQRGISGESEPPAVASAPAAGAAPAIPAASYSVQESEDHGPMMLVPAGPFLFGPERRVVNLAAFWIDKFPVTNRQYDAFCRATSYRFPKYAAEKRFAHPDAPVVGVSILDVQKYARWVGKTLPTEEQWEKATRGVDGRVYPWGDAPVDDARAWHGQDPSKGGTRAVTASVEGASPYGVRDLSGNVWEWTGTALEDGEPLHVIKGGCYNDPPEFLRADARLESPPKDKHETIGFRLVKPA